MDNNSIGAPAMFEMLQRAAEEANKDKARIADLEAFVRAWDATQEPSTAYNSGRWQTLNAARAVVGPIASERERRGIVNG